MQNQQPPRRRRPMTPEERAMAAERRRQKEILRRRAMRRYYAFLALLGALALAALVGLFFLIKAAAGWARGGQASSVSAAQSWPVWMCTFLPTCPRAAEFLPLPPSRC